jgi:ribosome modulation factor
MVEDLEMKMKSTKANPDIVEGYMDGISDKEIDFPERIANRSRSYKHGWRNGRDDRVSHPRKTFDELSRDAEAAMKQDKDDYA